MELSASVATLRAAHEELERGALAITTTCRAVERQRQRRQYLLELLTDGFLVTDAGGTIREMDTALRRLVGVSADAPAEEPAGKPFATFVVTQDQARLRSFLSGLSRPPDESLAEVRLRLLHRSGKETDVMLTAIHGPAWDGGSIYWVLHCLPEPGLAVMPPHESLDLEGSMSDARDAVSDWIETPLALIGGEIGLMLSGEAGRLSPDQRKALERIRGNVEQLAVAVDALVTGI
jgi:hypothetical protein